jgi:phosphoglycolate phosphatase
MDWRRVDASQPPCDGAGSAFYASSPVTAFAPAPLLVFDLDGTLAETAGDLMNTLNVVLESEGVAPLPLGDARFLLGAGARALIQRGFAAQKRTLSQEKLESLFKFFLAHYADHVADTSFLFPGVLAALDRFEAAGWAFSICTNKTELLAHKLMRELKVFDRFRVIAGQDTYAAPKPNKIALQCTIRDSGCRNDQAIMIGDSKTDIDTARNLGVPVIAVDFGYTDKPVTTLGPDVVISHFDQLWEAVRAAQAKA